MKNLKRDILITLLFMTIGIAAVTGNIILSGSTELAANTDDFDVYFSDVEGVNNVTGVTINTLKKFNFTTTLENLNQEAEISFKVTNASQNYDAEVNISCTGDTDYLKITPRLENTTVPARSEIDGNLKVKMIKSYVGSNKGNNITCTINANAVERNSLSTGIEYNEKLVMLKNYTARDAMGFGDYKQNIRTITFEDEINIPDDAIETWDFGVSENGNVIAYIVDNKTYDGYYDLYIQSNEQLYGNTDMSYWFDEFYSLETINNIELLDTSRIVNMNYMFSGNSVTALDLTGWDTGNVINMRAMFSNTQSLTTISGLNTFNTSKVTDMNSMFGYSSVTTLDLTGWDTSNVTDMSSMFADTYSLTTITGLNAFDTSSVKNMSYMFAYSSVIDLDFTDWDTSKVTSMSGMLYYTGFSSTILNTSITIRNPNTTSYNEMLYSFVLNEGTSFTINYTSETESLVDKMIATKTDGANVFKGTLVD